ncbi:MAG: hypothetical protein LBU32_28495 [Clostridiales bacterium]|jgi:hypothetical protein|nr:hypothetical protein [Clostridiales bacterium]
MHRITIFAGHYGSGKTNLAVNHAFQLRKSHPDKRIAVCDLDIANPYFRALDSKKALEISNIEMIASGFSNSNLEAPSIPSSVSAIFDCKDILGIIDVGGDDRGAYALGRYSGRIAEEGAQILLVCNCFRPLSKSPLQIESFKREIEAAANVRFTGMVNNSNLGSETTAEDVLKSMDFIDAASAACGLPVVFTAARRDLLPSLEGKMPGLVGIDIFRTEKWRI